MTVGERLELAVLTVAGFLTGILTTAFVLATVGGVPFPISALVAGVVNVALLRLAGSYTASAWQYGPIVAWTFVTMLAVLPIFGNGTLVPDWRLLLLLGCGLAAPAVYVSTMRFNDPTGS
ncbi:hypothetical protein [Gordonia shandongensis]|uniref:hypothetical protein n=1 Tax=Gordonia shandongensis TaxID=376351 RepID=UPI00041D8DC6|nr:hypothetical protein [Gordonia shandongensis]